MALDQLITHVVNHGTHHRAETGMLLDRIGRSPGDMDRSEERRVGKECRL